MKSKGSGIRGESAEGGFVIWRLSAEAVNWASVREHFPVETVPCESFQNMSLRASCAERGPPIW